MIEQAFEVATEFRFDVGQALLNTKALQGAVDDLSKSADGALSSLSYLASGLVAHLGFGSGGLLSVLTKAVSISEEFNAQALNFANNISTNIGVLSGTIDTFNDRLTTSKMLMGNISQTAIKFGLNTQDLASITQRIATPLANRGKLGTNYEGGIKMARNLMLSSEAVGLHPQVAAESLSRALTDHMAIHGALFARLVNTPAFKSAHIKTQSQVMNMNTDKKIDLLNKALEQLGGDAGFISNRINQMGVQFTILKDQIEVLLKPIGDAIIKPIKSILKAANTYLMTHGKELGENIGKLIGNIFEDPAQLFVGLQQLRSFGGDFKKALHLTELVQLFMFIKWGLGKLGIILDGGLLRRGLSFVVEQFAALAAWLGSLGIFGKIFSLLKAAIVDVLPMFAGLLFFLQIISRARAIGQLENIKNLLELTPKFAALFVRLKDAMSNILLPINMAIDFWARLIAPLFETSTILNILLPVFQGFAIVLELIGDAVVYVTAGISGLLSVLIGFMYDITSLKNPFKNVVGNFKEGFQDFLNQHPMTAGGNTPATKSVVYNNNHIEARFDMREQLEPDRIAFAVTTHLKKLALNPTQGRGQSFSGALAGNQGVAGDR